MTDAEKSLPNQRPETSETLSMLTRQVDVLSGQFEALNKRIEGSLGELRARVDTAVEALELILDDDPTQRRRLRHLRTSVAYDEAFNAPAPLVSVVIPTWNRAEMLMERSIPSALAQTHTNIEVVIVGDCSPPSVGQVLSDINDPRIRFHNLTIRGPYSQDNYRAWLASGTPGLNAGIAMARGLWIAPLGDDDAFVPGHIERLLAEARSRRLEFVYGRIRVILPDGREDLIGEFPPRLAQVGVQAALYHAGLRFMEYELGHAVFGKPNDWGLIHRMMRTGVRMGMVDEVSVDYRPSPRAQTPRPTEELPDLMTLTSELEAQLTEAHHRNNALEAVTADLSRRLEEVCRSRRWRFTAPLRHLRGRRRP